jgi:hypothetical protein
VIGPPRRRQGSTHQSHRLPFCRDYAIPLPASILLGGRDERSPGGKGSGKDGRFVGPRSGADRPRLPLHPINHRLVRHTKTTTGALIPRGHWARRRPSCNPTTNTLSSKQPTAPRTALYVGEGAGNGATEPAECALSPPSFYCTPPFSFCKNPHAMGATFTTLASIAERKKKWENGPRTTSSFSQSPSFHADRHGPCRACVACLAVTHWALLQPFRSSGTRQMENIAYDNAVPWGDGVPDDTAVSFPQGLGRRRGKDPRS